MCWVVLDRAIRISERTNDAPAADVARGRKTRQRIFDQVLERGWSEKLGCFRQRYESDGLDSALLLIPVMEQRICPSRDAWANCSILLVRAA